MCALNPAGIVSEKIALELLHQWCLGHFLKYRDFSYMRHVLVGLEESSLIKEKAAN